MKVEVKLNHFRTGLGEGRSSNYGYGFLKKIDKTHFETVSPLSPCKDYLNEVMYCEQTEILPGRIHGFQYEKFNGIKGKNYWFLGVRMCTSKKSSEESDYTDTDEGLAGVKRMPEAIANSLKFINGIEEHLNLPYKTLVREANNNIYVIYMPMFWSQRMYLLSMYTLLLRAYQEYDGSMPAIEYWEKKSSWNGDSGLIMSSRNNMKRIFNGELPEQDWKIYEGCKNCSSSLHHSSGICSYPLPQKK